MDPQSHSHTVTQSATVAGAGAISLACRWSPCKPCGVVFTAWDGLCVSLGAGLANAGGTGRRACARDRGCHCGRHREHVREPSGSARSTAHTRTRTKGPHTARALHRIATSRRLWLHRESHSLCSFNEHINIYSFAGPPCFPRTVASQY